MSTYRYMYVYMLGIRHGPKMAQSLLTLPDSALNHVAYRSMRHCVSPVRLYGILQHWSAFVNWSPSAPGGLRFTIGMS